MLGFLVGIGSLAVGVGCVYGFIAAIELLSSLVTPGGTGAAMLAVAVLALLAVPVVKWVGEGILEARSRR